MRQREQDLDKTMTRIDDKWRHHHYLHIPLGDSSPSPSQHLPQIREAENKPSQALPSLSPTSLRKREAEEQQLPQQMPRDHPKLMPRFSPRIRYLTPLPPPP